MLIGLQNVRCRPGASAGAGAAGEPSSSVSARANILMIGDVVATNGRSRSTPAIVGKVGGSARLTAGGDDDHATTRARPRRRRGCPVLVAGDPGWRRNRQG